VRGRLWDGVRGRRDSRAHDLDRTGRPL
jgi:hypothetical protein